MRVNIFNKNILQGWGGIVLGLIALVCPLQIFAQLSDSLYNALPTDIKPKHKTALGNDEKVQILSSINIYYNPSFKSELRQMAVDLQLQAASTKNLDSKIEYLFASANFYMTFSNDSAILCYQKLIEYLNGQKGYENAVALVNFAIATNYGYKERYDLAIDALQEGLAFSLAAKDSNLMVRAFGNYGLIYSKLGMFDRAIAYGKLVLLWTKQQNKGDIGYVQSFLNVASFYSQLYGQSQKIPYRDTAYKMVTHLMRWKKNEDTLWFGACYYFMGYLDFKQGNYHHAITMFDSSLLDRYNRYSRYTANYDYARYMYKAACLIKLGNYLQGKQILDTLKIGPGRFSSKKVAYQALYEQAEASGNYKDAFEYHKKYKLYADSLDIESQKGKVFEATQKYSVAEKEASIANLENENLKKEKQGRKWLSITIVGAVILFIIIVVLYLAYKQQQLRRLAERQHLEDELHLLEQEISRKHQQGIEEKSKAVIDQRKDISRDMHDELSPGLAALNYFVADTKKKLKNEINRGLFEEIEQETQYLYQHARQFMRGLFDNSSVSQFNVPAFLRNLSNRFGDESSLKIISDFDAEGINACFTLEQHLEMYCIIREAVANAMKYSGASFLSIKLVVHEGLLHFEIRDNGKGIDRSSNVQGLGLSSITERVKKMNGKMNIDGSQKGVVIEGSFPCDNAWLVS